MCYMEYARESANVNTTDKEQKKEITEFANKCSINKWLEMDGNVCIISRTKQKNFGNKMYILVAF